MDFFNGHLLRGAWGEQRVLRSSSEAYADTRLQVGLSSAPGGIAGAGWRGGVSVHPTGIVVAWVGRRVSVEASLPAALDRSSFGLIVADVFSERSHAVWPEIRGEFAVVLWEPAKAQLYLVSDPAHSVSIYYGVSHDRSVHFGTHLAGVARALGTSAVLDEDWLLSFAVGASREPGSTCLESTRVVPGGYLAECNEDGILLRRYWRPRSSQVLVRDSDVVDEFQARLKTTLTGVLTDCAAPAVALSGGLDSSSILRALIDLHPASVTAISFQQPGSAYPDESHYARSAVRGTAVPMYVIHQQSECDLGEVLEHASEPESIERLPLLLSVAKKAAEVGCPVLLTGAFGDVVAGFAGKGRPCPATSATGDPIPGALDELRASARRLLAQRRVRVAWSTVVKDLDALIRAPRDWSSALNRLTVGSELWHTSSWPLHVLFANYIPDVVSSAQRVSRLIESLTGVAVIHPFSDLRLLELGSALPEGLRYGEEGDRVVLRRAMKDSLPDSIRLRRTKSEYSQFFGRFFRQALASQMLSGEVPAIARVTSRSWAGVRAEASHSRHSVLRSVFRIAVTGAWLRQLGVDG